MDGLEALVRSRGGIETLVDNPLLMRFIYWYVELEIGLHRRIP
jgi:hypothetical protein